VARKKVYIKPYVKSTGTVRAVQMLADYMLL